MNHSPYPPYMPPLTGLPLDQIHIPSFAVAGEPHFAHFNQTLGIALEAVQYRHLQQHFFRTEAKNPTLGELRLLGHILNRSPLSHRIAPGELYTDSREIMDTWADAMAGYQTSEDQQPPCTLSQVLSLPETYLMQAGRTVPSDPSPRLVSDAGALEAFSRGFRPLLTVSASGGAPRQLWVKAQNPAKGSYECSPDVGDVLLLLPPTRPEVACAFLYDHPVGAAVKAAVAVSDTSTLRAALTMCNGWGLTVELDTLVPLNESVHDSRIARYLSVWECVPPKGTAYVLLRIAPSMQAKVFTTLSEHGLSPRVLGTVTKKPRLTVYNHGALSVDLRTSVVLDSAPRIYRCVLSQPAPLCASWPDSLCLSPMYTVEGEGCTMVDATLSLSGDTTDGFTPTIQGALALCCEFAAAGISYDRVWLSPVLYFSGNPEAPLLLSAVCGLYRAMTELGLHASPPEILFKQVADPRKETSLVVSLVAYSHDTPHPHPTTLCSPDNRPLCFATLDTEPAWADIRGLMFTVAKAVREGDAVTAHTTRNQSVLSLLTRLASPEVNVSSGLYDRHKALLSAHHPLGFLLEGTLLEGGVHIGVTCPRPEHVPLPPPQAAPSAAFKTVPHPACSLDELKNKETQRRKELAAMEKIKAFEPLNQTPRTVLLDTDIGPDCDDVGALAVLIYYANQYGFPIGGICNCTSNKAGNGVIDAVCRRCGMETPPLGQWGGEGFMDGQEHCKYNTAVAEAHSEAYRNGTLPVEDAVTYYRKRLAEAKDGDVMVISIGMFNNLAALLDSPADDISPLSGLELVKAKVYALVSMAAILPQGRECNVICDYPAAEKVFASWPTDIYLSDFHIGVNVKTGYAHITDPEAIMADPLPMSYHLYTKEWNWEGAVKGQNASYDLTAVQFAALGICDLYDLGTPGDLEFYAEIPDLPDATRFIENPMGNKIFMVKKVPDETIAESLQNILTSFI